MKVVDVNPFFYPFKGGIEHRMHDTSRLLTKNGHEVTILTSRLPNTPEEEKTEDGYRIIRLESEFLNIYNPPFVKSEHILNTLESINPDIVNFNYRWAPSYTRDLKKYDGKKVFTYHNMWGEGIGLQSIASRINDNLFRSCLDTFDHIIAVSDYVRKDLIKHGYPSENVTTVQTGLSNFHGEKGCIDGDFILSIGRQVKTKGLEYLIKAMTDVDCKLILCGKGPESKSLERMIKNLNLEDKIEIKGWIDDSEKENLMASCKFLVMPSLYESLGLAAIEQLSYGKPVVCTNVNGLPETVGEGGIIVPPKNPRSLSEAMNLLLSDDVKRKDIGHKALLKAEEYRWENLIPKIESIYSRVLSE